MVKTALTNPTILIKPSRKLIDYINTITINEDTPQGIINISNGKRKLLKNHRPLLSCTEYNSNENCTLNLNDIHWIYEQITEELYFHELFEGSEIVLPENDESERNAELDLRCERLRVEQENEEYYSMTNNRRNQEDSVAFQIKQMNKQLLVVVQFIASIVAGFMFGFLGVELLIGKLNLGFRLLTGISCAVIVALAELYFLIRNLNEDVVNGNYGQGRSGRYSIKFE